MRKKEKEKEKEKKEKVKKGLILGQIRVADAEEELKRNMADWTKDKADETRWNIVTGKQIGRAHV